LAQVWLKPCICRFSLAVHVARVEAPAVAMKFFVACLLATVPSAEGVSTMLRSRAAAKVQVVADYAGENKAASQFFKEWLTNLPRNATKAKQQAVIASLEAEVDKLGKNVQSIKELEKKEQASKGSVDRLKGTLKGKDKEMMESMDQWSNRMNEKAKVGAMNVMSKLKNAIHLIKKGALSGNGDAENRLNDVLKHMSAMAR